MKAQQLKSINVAVRPVDGQATADLVPAIEESQTLRAWEIPENQQAKHSGRPTKRQSERSMRYENTYAHYLHPERMIERDRRENASAQAERARTRRAELAEISQFFDRNTKEGTIRASADGTVRVYKNGKWVTQAQSKATATPKAGRKGKRKSKLSEAEEEDLIARLATVGYPSRKFQASPKIGKAS